MLETIVEIANVGTFHRFRPEKPVELRKLTLIYGPNGTGKTTLCAILRSLARNEADILVGRKTLNRAGDSRVEIGLSGGGRCVWDGKAWSGARPKIEIFDEQFVRDNLYTDSVEVEQKRNLYRVIVGETAANLANRINQLTKDAAEKQRQITDIFNRLDRELQALGGAVNIEDFVRLESDPDIEAKIANKRRELAAHQNAAEIASTSKLAVLFLPELPRDLEIVLGRTLDTIEAEAQKCIAAHLERCGGAVDQRAWLERGLGFVRDETCPFCGQPLDGIALVRAYRAIFSDTYREHKETIEKARDALERDFGEAAAERLAKRIAENKRLASFWKPCLHTDPQVEWDTIENEPEWREIWEEFHQTAKSAMADKLRALLEAVAFDPVRPAFEGLGAALDGLRNANKSIEVINGRIEELKHAAKSEQLRAAKEELARLELVRKRYEPSVDAECERYKTLTKERETINEEKKRLQNELEKETTGTLSRCQDSVNGLLRKFGTGFEIVEIEEENPSGQVVIVWKLKILSKNVRLGSVKTSLSQPSFKNTLSAGDRSALGFAFFLAQLEHKKDLGDRIVVLDDPFTSQDWFRRGATKALLVEYAEKYGQMIICAHDSRFLLDIQKAHRNAQTFQSLELRFAEDGGSRLLEEDILFISRVTALADLQELRAFLERGLGKPIDIVRRIRPVLEAEFRRAYPGIVGPTTMRGQIVDIARGDRSPLSESAVALADLNEYTRSYHHGEDMRDGEWPPIDSQELRSKVRKTLELVRRITT